MIRTGYDAEDWERPSTARRIRPIPADRTELRRAPENLGYGPAETRTQHRECLACPVPRERWYRRALHRRRRPRRPEPLRRPPATALPPVRRVRARRAFRRLGVVVDTARMTRSTPRPSTCTVSRTAATSSGTCRWSGRRCWVIGCRVPRRSRRPTPYRPLRRTARMWIRRWRCPPRFRRPAPGKSLSRAMPERR